MRYVVSFILTSLIYSCIIYFLFFFLFPKPKKEPKIYIHTAIIAQKAKINVNSEKNKPKPAKQVSKIKKTKKTVKKSGSKSSLSKGGDKIKFNDIFKNVKYNVDTKKIKIKSSEDISRFKGIQRDLKKIKKISFEVNFIQTAGKKLTKEEIDDIISRKLYQIWDDISTLPSDYAKINIQSINGKVNVEILQSNLDIDKQNELVNRIENVKFDKNFNITVLFQSKVNND